MIFRTEVKLSKHPGAITHDSAIMMLGSCFSDNMAEQLSRRLFNVKANPFGTLFNPASISQTLQRIASRKHFCENEIFKSGNLYRSNDCHSSLCDISADNMLDILNQEIDSSAEFLYKATDVFLTFGTAWIYELKETGKIVANCHKQHPNMFARRKMSIDETETQIKNAIEAIKSVNPKAKIWLTVSPVRHLADGAHENNLSKATLLLASENVSKQTDIIYFPSYEIVLDELRDYRFFSSDMCHPSDMAVNYIYEVFSEAYFSQDTIELATKCEKLTRRMSHRPMTADNDAFEQFKKETILQQEKLLSLHPQLKEAMTRTLKKH